jgi:xylulose-5-phosphate/fructose-6-phosphate phosphoketolase
LCEILDKDVFGENFRVFSPDELASNRLLKVRETKESCVAEFLSEQTCFAWQLGYASAGGVTILVMYEGFSTLIATMLCQHAKFLAECATIEWRSPLPSVTVVLTSTAWSNVYSHQNPDLVGLLRLHEFPNVNVFTPINAEITTTITADALSKYDSINVIVATKHPVSLQLSQQQISDSFRQGWTTLSPTEEHENSCDLIFISVGDVATDVMMNAIECLRSLRHGVTVRSYGVSRLDGLSKALKYVNETFPTSPVIITSIAPREALKIEMFGTIDGKNLRFFGFRDKFSGFNPHDTLAGQGMAPEQVAAEAIELLAAQTSSVNNCP